MLLSQDEARFPLVPTLRTTLGVKGHRPQVGTWDNKDQVYCFAALNLVSGHLTSRLMEQPARCSIHPRPSKTKRLQVAFIAHLRDLDRAYPADQYSQVVLLVDNAPWHRGPTIEQTVAAYPQIRLYRLPSYSPQLNPIERFWRLLRRRATHNRLFDTMPTLRQTLRNNLRYYQTKRHKVCSLIENPWKSKTMQH